MSDLSKSIDELMIRNGIQQVTITRHGNLSGKATVYRVSLSTGEYGEGDDFDSKSSSFDSAFDKALANLIASKPPMDS